MFHPFLQALSTPLKDWTVGGLSGQHPSGCVLIGRIVRSRLLREETEVEYYLQASRRDTGSMVISLPAVVSTSADFSELLSILQRHIDWPKAMSAQYALEQHLASHAYPTHEHPHLDIPRVSASCQSRYALDDALYQKLLDCAELLIPQKASRVYCALGGFQATASASSHARLERQAQWQAYFSSSAAA